MKNLFLAVVATMLFTFCSAQEEEFEIHNNGLMYSESTMDQLKVIVDSLNLKFKTCDLNQTYASKCQARGHYISLDTGNIKAAVKDLESGISYPDFLSRYPGVERDTDLLVIKFQYENYEGRQVVEYSEMAFNKYYGYELSFEERPELYDKKVKNNWVFKYFPKSEYSNERVEAFYFTSEFETAPLSEKYARLIQYADCLIDTTSDIYREDVVNSDGFRSQRSSPELNKFMDYISEKTNKPEYDSENYEEYMKEWRKWVAERHEIIENDLAGQTEFKNLLTDAVTSTLKNGGSNDDFEEYVSRYYSKDVALELKRRRMVVGSCSYDNSPRIHAMNIAVLSAETFNWETFLRAHLNIMNDRFERASDGSYAWGARETYIKELEELDINVPDLLLGISLRIENPAKYHYYGSIGRLGRALAETKYADEIEERMLAMISDRELDDFNRTIMYLLFLSYNRHLEDEKRQDLNKGKLRLAVASLPEYIGTKVSVD